MNQLLPPWPLLSAFLVASLLLAVTPGPGVFYIVTRTLVQGRRVGLTSVAGVAAGNLANAVAASIGLAALFAVATFAFIIVQYAGAAYLVYVGICALHTPRAEALSISLGPAPPAHIFREGFVVALLNPKTAIFFAAFLPQFLGAGTTPMVQSALLGSLFVGIAATTDCAYALAAGAIAPALTRTRSVRALGRYLTASAFIGLGVFCAIGDSRTGT